MMGVAMRTVMMALAVLAPLQAVRASEEVAVSTVTGGMLASMCQRVVDARSMDPCNSFITAAADGLQFGRMICIKETSGYPYVVVGVVRKFLIDHPEHYGLPAIAVVDMALSEKFPCKPSA